MKPDNRGRASLVTVITTPLGFFALSLLIVEGFLAITMFTSGNDSGARAWGMGIGSALFIIVVAVVTILVWKKPQNLTFSEVSHIKHDEIFGSKESEQVSEKQLERLDVVSDSLTVQEDKR